MAEQNLTPEQIAAHKKQIDEMTHFQMAKFRRYAPPGHIYFKHGSPLFLYFENRFQNLGGMTPEISKAIGWADGVNRT